METQLDPRVRVANDRKPNTSGEYVLYWMQAFRRLHSNHALNRAIEWSKKLKKPLVVYEGLRLDYPWASARHHRFILDGMRINAARARRMDLNYWPFVETRERPARGLLKTLAQRACLIVTDDYPAFVVPRQIESLAARVDVPLLAVDGNSLVPLSQLGPTVFAAAHLRPRIHKLFADAWVHRAEAEPVVSKPLRVQLDPGVPLWDTDCDLDAFVAGLPIDQSVQPVSGVEGGRKAGKSALRRFLGNKLECYGLGRNAPDDPRNTPSSSLSPYLRQGHLSIQEIVEAVLNQSGKWTPADLDVSQRGKREGFFHPDANVNAFLDEAITWRDVGYHWHFRRNAEFGSRTVEWHTLDGERVPAHFDLKSTLPVWAMKTLTKHSDDAREAVYTLQEWEQARTHDPLWNAAQSELVQTGRIHNYLRMLWGKKVLEWSRSPEVAYLVLEHLNNKYAIDGRDPNSYTGILWCFGLFDRPWAPERKVFGTVRYMSSANTAKKFKLDGYYRYIKRLTGDNLPTSQSD